MWERNQQLIWRESRGALNAGAEPRNQMLRPTAAPHATPDFEPNNAILPALLKFFGLQQQPFGVTPDPSFLYLSRTHREALASLVYGIETGRGFLALIAPPGMGKTTLLFHLLEKFRDSARTAFLFQTQCTSREFLQFLCSDLGVASGGSPDFVRMHEDFSHHLMQEARVGKRLIVVVDEAQSLDLSVLETIRLLSNFETSCAKLIQIVLSGQPELGNKLASDEMMQLQQRLSSLSRLEPFSVRETEQYIQHRLRVAGHSGGPLLTADALAIVTEFSNGIPRKINNFCFNALSLAFATQQPTIDETVAREVLSDLYISPACSRPGRTSEKATTNYPEVSLPASEAAGPSSEVKLAMKEEANGGSDASLHLPQPNQETKKEITLESNVPPPASEPKSSTEKQGELFPSPGWIHTQTGPRPEFAALTGKTDYKSMPLTEAKEYMNSFIRSLRSTQPEPGS